MIRLIRTRTLDALRTDRAAQTATDATIQSEVTIQRLQQELADARADTARAEGERDALRAQHLLDAEDRVALRMLLRTARKQTATLDRVYVLFRLGQLHSIHASQDSAEATAESQGAARDRWTATPPGAAMPPASEVQWRIQPLPVGRAPA
ncbi:hypothetical protein ABZ330_00335 [Streptomyces sp. NPDC006172]|uniref:hypothetical protein n=1 Tax=Streptomyces sp. NPDC006172 TaxID=3154470 RepID=UPI0033C25498